MTREGWDKKVEKEFKSTYNPFEETEHAAVYALPQSGPQDVKDGPPRD